MTLPAQDIVERLRELPGREFTNLYHDAADTISRLTADNEALRKDNARLSEEKDALAFGMRHGQSLSEDAIHAIRELLNEAGVPLAAFIDDHVGNAIVQRNQERAKVTALEAEVGRLRKQLLRHGAHARDCERPRGPECDCGWDDLRAALANEEAGR